MKTLLLHPAVQSRLARLSNHLPQAILLHGQAHIGKTSVILNLIATNEPTNAQKVLNTNWQFLTRIDAEETASIGIETIKELEQFLHLKQTRPSYVVIGNAQKLTTEAQNAFLNTLEETPNNVTIFLTATELEPILPTIRSRMSTIHLPTPGLAQYILWLKNTFNIDEKRATQLYYLSKGAPGLTKILIDDKQLFSDSLASLELSKRLVGGVMPDRLSIINGLSNDNEQTNKLLENAIIVIRAGLHAAVKKPSHSDAVVWLDKLDLYTKCLEKLKSNVSRRLILDKIVLDL